MNDQSWISFIPRIKLCSIWCECFFKYYYLVGGSALWHSALKSSVPSSSPRASTHIWRREMTPESYPLIATGTVAPWTPMHKHTHTTIKVNIVNNDKLDRQNCKFLILSTLSNQKQTNKKTQESKTQNKNCTHHLHFIPPFPAESGMEVHHELSNLLQLMHISCKTRSHNPTSTKTI